VVVLARDVTRTFRRPALFYGWYIVGVGFLTNISCAFFISSTLSVFLKSVTIDLRVSRGVFSMMRSGEHLVYAALTPWVGSQLDRYGARWLMVIGAVLTVVGYLLLGHVQNFLHFVIVRMSLLAVGHALVCYFVVNVTVSRWFVKKRGRALALAHLGHGVAKVTISLVVASLLLLIGWRQVWTLFGALVFMLVVIPAAVFMRRSPEDMGLHPDGAAGPVDLSQPGEEHEQTTKPREELSADVQWTRKEVLRTSTFWLIVFIFGIVDVGITGLNLHVVAYVSDTGYSTVLAASVMTVIAATQLTSGLLWGFVSERVNIRKVTSLLFLIQAVGLGVAITAKSLPFLYLGFVLYGTGLGGVQILQEIMWADYFGRVSLGSVRGMSLPIVLMFGASGPPFFGFLFDYTGTYTISFSLFIVVLLISSSLTLLIRRPQKKKVQIITV
jgi:MFS transporter, OFA family, oxalate/formate antiporter